ncbi:hypothetical protein ID866_11973 [Astraeus odoratus]|nr:hypothetical protein ID866_11973 [Astraeus odoratus]
MQAKDYAAYLPGGELNTQEQQELIETLEKLWDHKKQQLAQFSKHVGNILNLSGNGDKIEIESTASTPVGS